MRAALWVTLGPPLRLSDLPRVFLDIAVGPMRDSVPFPPPDIPGFLKDPTPERHPMSEAMKDKKVLLVDDDHDILTSMQAAFEPTGAVIDMASNGNKAVELAEKNQPDLVVLDMMLPGRSGFLVLEKIKAKKPRNAKPFVIMITGNQGARHKMYAESLGVSEYLNKPVKMDKLIATAERLLGPAAAPAAQ